MRVPLLARMRNQYCVFLARPVTVSDRAPVVVLPAKVVAVYPLVNVELVARSMVKLVSLVELSVQVKTTERLLALFAPLVAAKLLGVAGTTISTEAVFE